MRASVELRWFYSGTLPKAIAEWFWQDSLGGYLSPPEEREDLYLLIPSCNYLGLKLRQKGLEVKWRQAELGPVGFGNRWEGKAEKWLKWVCVETATPVPTDILATGVWVAVKKKRSQRLYQVADGGLTPVPIEAPIPQGCSIEITQLSINGEAWWSLGFEAFGPDSALRENLKFVAGWASKSYPGQKLTAEDSLGYPQWLNRG
ncbi:MAG TPA: hypothetical protein VK211_19255 [Kamptonema sp.]|nr:hypothetical protein [Kamptonema sp.]